jgi:uncharacterized membrane protein
MDLKTLLNWGSEIVFCLCGLVSFNAAWRGLQNEKCRIGTFVFWTILGLIFILGPYIPYALTGALLLVLGCLTATKQVRMGKFVPSEALFRKAQADKLGNKIFLPAITIGVVALALSMLKFKVGDTTVTFPSALAIGLASILAYLIGVAITRPKFAETRDDTARLLMTVGAASLLPQLLGALGSVFTEAGVGAVISSIMANVVPQGSVVLGVIVYVAGMVLFTMVMGNAFAAFSVITVGIGVPFVILQGGDPAIVGALGMTAGFCGTLMTPMAANFNIVPAAVLETKNKYTVIKAQLPMALVMIVVHVVLMLVLAF